MKRFLDQFLAIVLLLEGFFRLPVPLTHGKKSIDRRRLLLPATNVERAVK
jgi:hypothetical protein